MECIEQNASNRMCPSSGFMLSLTDCYGKPNVPIFIVYLLGDIIAVCLNCLLVLLAMKVRAKHACTDLLIAFSIAHLLLLVTSIFSHFHNIYLLTHYNDEQMITPLGCLSLKPETFITLFGFHLISLLLFYMSLERMTWLAPVKMHSYLFTPQRTKMACFVFAIFAGTMQFFCFISIAESSTLLRPSQCTLKKMFPATMYKNITYWNLSISYCLGIVYLIFYFVYWYKKRTVRTHLQTMRLKRDEAYTRSLAIIVLVAIALYIFPRTLILAVDENEDAKDKLIDILNSLNHILSILTPLIYFCSNPDIKEQFWKLLNSIQWLKNRLKQQSSVVYIG
ncbi:hypothetical protein TTRE_0000180601 [Trichuris trichiura]|uniref:G-protein coupled receptors family 1 profile domain-containing protein n=1 Tax=Trichuris trichiura TaxID=36087 RepID=A0A077Z0G4_TRITR|nr:hypothetical protein TTRE_0000180601 [Trichuris trichiura]